jgi:hypothetical protein
MFFAVEWFPDEFAKGAVRDWRWLLELQGLNSRSTRRVDGGQNMTMSSDCVAQSWEGTIVGLNNPSLQLEVGNERFDATTVVIWVDSGDDNPEQTYEA